MLRLYTNLMKPGINLINSRANSLKFVIIGVRVSSKYMFNISILQHIC